MAESVEDLFPEEFQTFRARLPGWSSQDIGKFVLIKGNVLYGSYDSRNDAITVGYQEYGNVTFLTKELMPEDVPAI